MKFYSFLKDCRLINKKFDNPDRYLDCRSKSEKAGFRSKIFDRDPIFLDFDPERIAIQRSQSIVIDWIQIFVLCVFLILELKTSNFKLLNLFCLRGTVWENGTIQYSLVDLKCFFFWKPISSLVIWQIFRIFGHSIVDI